MLNSGSKTSPSSQIFNIPSNFWNHRWGTETGAFPWPSCYCFCKKWSNYNISSCYFKHKSMKSLSFKKVSDGKSNIHITIKYVFLFLQIIIRSQKNWCETLKLQFILMWFDRCLSDTSFRHDALHFTFWDKKFSRICFYKFSFFIPSFRHQD